jgi:DNA-binding response OmpR family regulator
MEGATPTVLVVEDDRAMRLLCRVSLELDGYRVLEAPTLDVARTYLATDQIDVVVLDVHVAGDSGFDLIEIIQAPIAVMTGSAELGPDERARVDTVLIKPFEPEDLNAAVARLAGAIADY